MDEAVEILAAHGDDAKALAGGQSLVPMLALRLTRFDHLVDLNRIAELTGVRHVDGTLEIGAMTRQAFVGNSADVRDAVPLLSRATIKIGHFQIRNRGTIGGSIAHADPAAEYPAVAVALDAELEVRGPSGTRSIPSRQFFLGTWTTQLAAEELLTSIRFPVPRGRHGSAVEEVALRAGDFALAGAAASAAIDGDGAITRLGLGLFGVGLTPVAASAVEQAVVGRSASELTRAGCDELGRLALEDIECVADLHAPASYRKSVGAHVASRALENALREALDD
jgi:aerobic carbon-monoxide dehydrogenase medium subunit